MEVLILLLTAGLAIGLGGLGGGGGSGGGAGGGDGAEGPPPTAEGDAAANTLVGTPLQDAIYGREGDDTITGLESGDYLDGNADNDSIDGGDGDDTIHGGAGNDILMGGDDQDSILGFAGQDTLEGGAGNDSMRGGLDADSLVGGTGNDSLEGGSGDDIVDGLLTDYTAFPTTDTDGADTLEGWGGADTIILGNGDQAYGEFATTIADGAGDTFIVGTWITGTPATIHDFDPAVDQIDYYRAGGETLAVNEVNNMGDVTFELTADGDVVLRIPVGSSGLTVTLGDINVVSPPP